MNIVRTPFQDREVRIKREEAIKQKQLSDRKKINTKPFISVYSNNTNNKIDRTTQNSIDIRAQERAKESALSRRKAHAQQMVELGVLEPIEDMRNFEEKQGDFYLQQRLSISNTKKLIDNDEEANRLLNYLRNADLLNDFNNQFQRIQREIKSNYNYIGAFEAFQEIKQILNQANDRPITEGVFKQGVQGLIRLMQAQMAQYQSTNQQMYKQLGSAILKLQALDQVRNDTSNKLDFDETIGLTQETINEVKSAVDAGQNPNKASLLKNIEKGALDLIDDNDDEPNIKEAVVDGEQYDNQNIQYLYDKLNKIPDDISLFDESHAKILKALYNNEQMRNVIIDKIASLKDNQPRSVKTSIKSRGVDEVVGEVLAKSIKIRQAQENQQAQGKKQALEEQRLSKRQQSLKERTQEKQEVRKSRSNKPDSIYNKKKKNKDVIN